MPEQTRAEYVYEAIKEHNDANSERRVEAEEVVEVARTANEEYNKMKEEENS